MAIPEPIEAFPLRLGFDYSTLHLGGDGARAQDPADPHQLPPGEQP